MIGTPLGTLHQIDTLRQTGILRKIGTRQNRSSLLKTLLFLALGSVLCFNSFSLAQETTAEPLSTEELANVQELIDQAIKTDNQLVKLLGAQIQDAAEAQQEIDALSASLAAKTQEVATLQTESDNLKSQYAGLSGELDGSKQEVAALQEQIAERANELQVVIQERDIIQSAFARVQDTADKGKVRIAELEELQTTNTATIEGLQERVSSLEAQYQAAIVSAETIKEEALKVPAIQDRLSSLEVENTKLQDHIQRVTNSRNRLKIEHERTLLEIDSFEQAMTDAIFRANALEAQLRSAGSASDGQLQSLRQQYADAQSQIFSLEGSLEGARGEVTRLQSLLEGSEAGELTQNLSTKDAEISSLKDQVATLRTTIINLPNSDQLLTLEQERDTLKQELDTVKAQLSNFQANAAAASIANSGATTTTTSTVESTPALAAPLVPTAASELPADLDQAKAYATLKLNEYYLFRDKVTDLGANVTLLELNQREEALLNLQEAQSHVANLMGAEIHTVQPGDSLTAISSSIYGSINRWEDILAENSYIIDNPDLIFPGFQLIIPQ